MEVIYVCAKASFDFELCVLFLIYYMHAHVCVCVYVSTCADYLYDVSIDLLLLIIIIIVILDVDHKFCNLWSFSLFCGVSLCANDGFGLQVSMLGSVCADVHSPQCTK